MAEDNLLVSYEGRGKLIWSDGMVSECKFRAEHDPEHGLFLYCTLDDADPFLSPGQEDVRFEGMTSDGAYRVVTEDEVILTRSHLSFGEAGNYTRTTFWVRVLRLIQQEGH